MFCKSSTFLAWAAWQLQYSTTAWELSENILQNLRNKWPPHLVDADHFGHSVSMIANQQDVATPGPEGARLDDERHGSEGVALVRLRPYGRHGHGLDRQGRYSVLS